MDLIAEGWESDLDMMVRAEALAARVPGAPETCAGGVGVGGCEAEQDLNEVCKVKVKRLAARPSHSGGTFVLSDSAYSIRSDGLGPYRGGSGNVRLTSGGVSNAFVLAERSPGPTRSFTVDLGHPVPTDIGAPRGTTNADAMQKRPFSPAGSNYSLEIGFLYRNTDTTKFTGDIPVGSTVHGSVFMNFYLNGLLHVLYAGPTGTAELCSTYGSAVYGDGTTAPTIFRASPTSWVVDLPPGSIARLFDSHREEKNAVNRGLYYLSMHAVLTE